MTSRPVPPRRADPPVARNDETPTIYLAVTLPTGIAPGDLVDVQRALADAARRTTEDGLPVRFVHGMYLPAHGSLLCAFDAADARAVHVTARRAGLPFRPVDSATATRLTADTTG